jgi:hypothetical protein
MQLYPYFPAIQLVEGWRPSSIFPQIAKFHEIITFDSRVTDEEARAVEATFNRVCFTSLVYSSTLT